MSHLVDSPYHKRFSLSRFIQLQKLENYAKERRNDNGKYEKYTAPYGNSVITFSFNFLY